ncbi:Nuclear control of ATPase protein 2 [Microbotryomycetes sp. JL221]|nr:Nuclear control of ATPase protein 2 [Microbotryomycetes sp. JL221]
MSYAADQSQALSAALATITPHLVASPPRTPAHSGADQEQASFDHSDNAATRIQDATSSDSKLRTSQQLIKDRASSLRSILTRLHPGHSTSSSTIAQLVDQAFPPAESDGSINGVDQKATFIGSSHAASTAELVTLAQLTVSSFGAVLDELLDEASELGHEDDWWARTESDKWRTGFYLLQTAPSRAISLTLTTVSRLRQLTNAAIHANQDSPSFLALSTYKTALPPSALLMAAFPHLNASTEPDEAELMKKSSADEAADSGPLLTATRLSLSKSKSTKPRSLFFLTLSPLALTRQEIAHKRAEIRANRQDLATRVGELTLGSARTADVESTGSDVEALKSSKEAAHNLSSLLATVTTDLPDASELQAATWCTIRNLAQAIATSEAPMSLDDAPPSTTHDMARHLSDLLNRVLPAHHRHTAEVVEPLRRPPFLTRAWPYLLSVPLVGLVLGRTIYSNRDTIVQWFVNAGETARSFLVDWVVEPVKDILQTVRGGEGAGMTLMGRESLKSDLESLERMVVDFGREQYKLPDAQLQELAQKVRDGNLTTVLKAWEQDIKSPIRSAIGGNLIRTLLIQVQKLKVDVDTAVTGVESMLKSQQLTFGFVGVAPSLLVLYVVGRWFKGLMRTDGGKKKAREHRRKCWMTMRELDLLLSPPRKTPSSSSPAMTQGLLILSLASLRSYATSNHFPKQDTQLRVAFLDDVRALEDEGARAQGEARRVLLARLWRWSDTLGWHV